MALLIIPIFGIMIWNGTHGKGYVINFHIPDKGSPYRLLGRIGLGIYSLALFTVVIYIQSTEDQANGLDILHTIKTLGLLFLVITLLILGRKYYQNKRK